MAALGAHTLRTQTIPKGPKPIAARPRFVGWKLEKFDILKGGPGQRSAHFKTGF